MAGARSSSTHRSDATARSAIEADELSVMTATERCPVDRDAQRTSSCRPRSSIADRYRATRRQRRRAPDSRRSSRFVRPCSGPAEPPRTLSVFDTSGTRIAFRRSCGGVYELAAPRARGSAVVARTASTLLVPGHDRCTSTTAQFPALCVRGERAEAGRAASRESATPIANGHERLDPPAVQSVLPGAVHDQRRSARPDTEPDVDWLLGWIHRAAVPRPVDLAHRAICALLLSERVDPPEPRPRRGPRCS